MRTLYFIKIGDSDPIEVSKKDFVGAERAAGFHNTLGQPLEPATASFSAGSIRGFTRWLDDDTQT